jgi:hypothetical protein
MIVRGRGLTTQGQHAEGINDRHTCTVLPAEETTPEPRLERTFF